MNKKKFKIFGRNLEWYDIKTKFKKLLRGLFYLKFTQKLICYIISGYLWLVYLTSRVKFEIPQEVSKATIEKKPMIVCFWHNRIALSPFYGYYVRKKIFKNARFISLASKHGDGRFVGYIMEIFGYKNFSGSSQKNRKASRGIDMASLKSLIKELKSGSILGITPDGPRGPNQKVNSEIINIARLSKALILPISASCSRYKEFRSWDKFKLPLPFSRIDFYCEKFFEISKNDSEEEIKQNLEKELNKVQEISNSKK